MQPTFNSYNTLFNKMHYRIFSILLAITFSLAGTTAGMAQEANSNASEPAETPVILYSGTPKKRAIADIKMGEEEATAWGCDLTYDYVKINADYRS